MKKILLVASIFAASVFGMNIVRAEEIDLTEDIDTNTYIIGDRVYELNEYLLSVYDIVSATNEYAKKHNGKIAPIYYLGEGGNGRYLLEITGSADPKTGEIPTKEIPSIKDVYPDNMMDATAINGSPLYDYIENDLEPKIRAAVEKLNETAKEKGFESITYKNETVTFTIADLTRSLADYKDSGIVDLFLSTADGAKSASYTVGQTTITENLTEATNAKIIAMAKKLLQLLSGDGDLTYNSIANKSASATMLFEHDGYEYKGIYTVEFVYDVEKVKDAALEEVAGKLNEKASDYGFESIAYKDKTATFTIADLTRSLADYKDSGIVDYFIENVNGATKVKYTIGQTTKEKDLIGLTNASVVSMAKELLQLLAGEGDLTYNSVANKSVEVELTYMIGGEEIVVPYVLEFVYDIEKVKDEALATVAEELNKNASTYGFKSIAYEDKTATFTIEDGTKLLVDYKDSGIVEYFIENVKGATKAEYTVGETTKEKELTGLTNAGVVSMAKELLQLLAGEGDLTLASVANKSVSADITFVVGGEEKVITYTLTFTMIEEQR